MTDFEKKKLTKGFDDEFVINGYNSWVESVQYWSQELMDNSKDKKDRIECFNHLQKAMEYLDAYEYGMKDRNLLK